MPGAAAPGKCPLPVMPKYVRLAEDRFAYQRFDYENAHGTWFMVILPFLREILHRSSHCTVIVA